MAVRRTAGAGDQPRVRQAGHGRLPQSAGHRPPLHPAGKCLHLGLGPDERRSWIATVGAAQGPPAKPRGQADRQAGYDQGRRTLRDGPRRHRGNLCPNLWNAASGHRLAAVWGIYGRTASDRHPFHQGALDQTGRQGAKERPQRGQGLLSAGIKRVEREFERDAENADHPPATYRKPIPGPQNVGPGNLAPPVSGSPPGRHAGPPSHLALQRWGAIRMRHLVSGAAHKPGDGGTGLADQRHPG